MKLFDWFFIAVVGSSMVAASMLVGILIYSEYMSQNDCINISDMETERCEELGGKAWAIGILPATVGAFGFVLAWMKVDTWNKNNRWKERNV